MRLPGTFCHRYTGSPEKECFISEYLFKAPTGALVKQVEVIQHRHHHGHSPGLAQVAILQLTKNPGKLPAHHTCPSAPTDFFPRHLAQRCVTLHWLCLFIGTSFLGLASQVCI
jgi:hypothetical protein